MLSVSFWGVTEALLFGFGNSLLIFFFTLLFALPLGFVFAFGAMSRIKGLRWFFRGFIWVIRGTPLMLQVIVVFYGPGLLFGPTFSFQSRLAAVILAFAINYACYFGEIYRGGIESIPQGQYEAAKVLGLNRKQTFANITLPQVIKRIIPAMSNEIITLIKDTALANIIAVGEIIMVAKETVSINGVLWPLFFTAAFYLLFSGLLTLIFNKFEAHYRYYRSI